MSNFFALPSWQGAAAVPASSRGMAGRGVSDVAAVADPTTGYEVLVDGEKKIFGGTNAGAPLWAALVARFAQATGEPFGLLQPRLYGAGSAVSNRTASVKNGFRDITAGNNGTYVAGPGWDACTGLGVPDGTALLAALTLADVTGPR